MDKVNSTIVAALEDAWIEICAAHKDVPPAVMVVASGTMGRSTPRLGHYAGNRWTRKAGKDKTPEVLISGEGFQRSSTDVMNTLLHEAAHGVAATRKLKDTSRNGRYHNKVFASLAEELGLQVEKMGSFGLAHTLMPKDTATKWKTTIKALDAAIKKHYRLAEGRGQGKKNGTRMLLATCNCKRKIRLSRAVFEAAPIICGACDKEFVLK